MYDTAVTTEEIIIAVVRVVGSLPVLAFPFPGAILAMLVDLSDLFLMNLLFEVTQERDVLILFPNLFEFWFVFVAGAKFLRLDERWRGEPRIRGLVPFRYTRGQLAAVLPVLLAVKLLQEFALHVGRWFDSFTAVEAVEWLWRFLTPPYY